jgi:hypothetical protein
MARARARPAKVRRSTARVSGNARAPAAASTERVSAKRGMFGASMVRYPNRVDTAEPQSSTRRRPTMSPSSPPVIRQASSRSMVVVEKRR